MVLKDPRGLKTISFSVANILPPNTTVHNATASPTAHNAFCGANKEKARILWKPRPVLVLCTQRYRVRVAVFWFTYHPPSVQKGDKPRSCAAILRTIFTPRHLDVPPVSPPDVSSVIKNHIARPYTPINHFISAHIFFF